MRARIQARLGALGIDQYDAAAQAGLSRTAVWAYLRGDTDTMRRGSVEKLAKVLQCEPAYLINGGNAPPVDGAAAALAPAATTQTLGISGIISGSAWYETARRLSVPFTVPRDPRYPDADQIALQVSGDEWREFGIMDGSIVVVADIAPRENDRLAIEITRNNGEKRTQIGRQIGGRAVTNPQPNPGCSTKLLGVIVSENQIF